MENHPIPQDVTGFQFKLIGNMTIKQFAYLATGIILAWIIFQLPILFLIKIPLAIFFAVLGLGLAYLPVAGRPMDTMIANFIKALFRPTKFVYEKSGNPLYFPGRATSARELKNTPVTQSDDHNPPAQPADNIIIAPPKPKPASNPEPNTKPIALNTAQKPETPQADPPKKPSFDFAQRITKISAQTAYIPDSPSLIAGIAKDPRGNSLPNILVEVKDKEGNPIRAFKTNEVGRFVSATALLNGTYTIEFEDPKGIHKFEKKTVEITGQIVPPIEATSIDPREELRRSLFSNNSGQNS